MAGPPPRRTSRLLGCLARPLERLVDAARHEVERRPTFHRERGARVVRQDEDGDVVGRVLAPPASLVRGADTGRLDLAPQAPGLLALSLGLSALFSDDHEMLRHGMVMYDALYAWLKNARGESHGWPPKAVKL